MENFSAKSSSPTDCGSEKIVGRDSALQSAPVPLQISLLEKRNGRYLAVELERIDPYPKIDYKYDDKENAVSLPAGPVEDIVEYTLTPRHRYAKVRDDQIWTPHGQRSANPAEESAATRKVYVIRNTECAKVVDVEEALSRLDPRRGLTLPSLDSKPNQPAANVHLRIEAESRGKKNVVHDVKPEVILVNDDDDDIVFEEEKFFVPVATPLPEKVVEVESEAVVPKKKPLARNRNEDSDSACGLRQKLSKKTQAATKKKIFEGGKLKDYSADALYYLHREAIAQEDSRKYRRDHMCRDHISVPCRICKKPLGSRSHLHAFKEHGPEYLNVCPLCPETALEDLRHHYSVVHFKLSALSCNLCQEVFYKPRDLNNHIVKHYRPDDVFKCETCSFNFASRENLREHEKMHVRKTGIKKTFYVEYCDKCDFTISGTGRTYLAARMEAHVTQTHSLAVRPIDVQEAFKCPLCVKEFRSAVNLKTHLGRMHPASHEKPFLCPFPGCGKVFRNKVNVTNHQIYHRPPKFRCDKCGRVFYHRKYQIDHKCPLEKYQPTRGLKFARAFNPNLVKTERLF